MHRKTHLGPPASNAAHSGRSDPKISPWVLHNNLPSGFHFNHCIAYFHFIFVFLSFSSNKMLASHLTFSSALLLLFPFGGAASPAELHSRLRPHGNAGVAGFGTNRALPTSNLYPGEAQAAPERQDPEGFTSYSLPSSPTYKPSPTSVITDGTLSQAHGGVYPAAPSRWKHAAGLTRAARTKSTPPSSFTKPAQASKHLAPVSGTTVAQDSTSSHTVTLRNAGSAHLIPNSYIIKYNISHGHEAIRAHVEHTMRLMRKRTLNASAPMDFRVYNVSTFVAMGLSSVSTGTMEAMASHAAVEYVEADTLVFAQGWATQPGAEAGLARLSHCAPGAHRPYVYDATAGAGATAYVVDTGIHVNHPDFENRATHGFNVLAGNVGPQGPPGPLISRHGWLTHDTDQRPGYLWARNPCRRHHRQPHLWGSQESLASCCQGAGRRTGRLKHSDDGRVAVGLRRHLGQG